MPAQPMELPFPVKGIDENWAYRVQPQGTTPDCLNVRGYDVIQQRLRGGQRAGVSKYISTQPNGSNPLQMLVQEPLIASGFAETFQFANGTDFDAQGSPWRHYAFRDTGTWIETPSGGTSPSAWVTAIAYKAGDQVVQTAVKYVCILAHTSGVFATDLAYPKWTTYTPLANPGLIQGNAYRVTATTPGTPTVHMCQTPAPTGNFTASMVITHVGAVDESCIVGLLIRASETTGYYVEYFAATSWASPIINVWDELGNMPGDFLIMGYPQTWAPVGAAPGQTTQNTPVRLTVAVEDTTMRIYLNGVQVSSMSGITSSANRLAGFTAISGGTFDITDFSLSGTTTSVSQRNSRILTCSNGSVYSGEAGSSWNLIATGMNTSGIVRAQAAFGKLYLCDGQASHYKVYDPTTQTVTAWTPTVGLLPIGAIDPSLGATISTLYRGRIVLSGIADDPQNWFMSKAGDPLDWDYGATVSAVMAVAGNNSVAGLVGDRITCLAPANDDLMVIGGDHTLWMMRGDPADGGRIDNISNQVGIVGPDAYTFDPASNLYFFGNGVLYRLPATGALEPISRGRLDKTFGAIDFSLNTMRLIWDELGQGIHIFITLTASGTSTHYFWDARTDSFWKDQYPDTVGPTSVLFFDADAQNDRAILLGGRDGYVRKVDSTSKIDDGATIHSRVKFSPIQPGGIHTNNKIHRMITRLDSASDPVDVKVYAAESPQQVVAATTPNWVYTATKYQPYAMPRMGGNSILVELENNSFSTAWASGVVYVVGSQVVASDGNPYVCIIAHTSTTGGAHPTPPGNTTDWSLSAFRTWAVETVEAIIEPSGRTRHGRI